MTMKKLIHSLIALLLVAFLLPCLVACQKTEPPFEPKNASELWAKIDETMTAQEQYEMTGKVRVNFYNMGYEYILDGSLSSTYGKDIVYNDSIVTVSCDALSFSQSIYNIDAFYENKMYMAYSDGVYEQKFCSPMTLEEYEAEQSDVLTLHVDMEDCTSAQFTKNENGSWGLEFSGYTKKTIDQVLKGMQLTEIELGASVQDMQVSLTADADFRVGEISIVFTFDPSLEQSVATPKLSVSAKYSNYNNVQFDPAKLDPEMFREVEDLRILSLVEESMAAKQDAMSGEFTLDLKTTYELMGQTLSSQESDVVTYDRMNGAYSYLITSVMDGQNFKIQYQNGQQTVDSDGQSHTSPQTEEEAKTFINGLMDSAKYNRASVADIQKQDEGVYVLTVDGSNPSEFISDEGMEITAAQQTIIVAFQGDRLLRLESTIVMEGSYGNEPMSVNIDSVVVFDN